MKIVLRFSLVALLVVGLISCGDTQQESKEPTHRPELWPSISSPPSQADVEAKVEELLAKMTLEEKVGQITQAEIQNIEPGDVKKYHLGSVLNGGGSWPHRKAHAAAADWVALADQYYDESMDDSDGYLAIPVIWGIDAVHGHSNVTGATLFPQNIGLGAMHDPDLVKKLGGVTAAEVRATGIEWVFAPTVAVVQNDRWGRTYESFSEDPELVRANAAAMVEGLQGAVGSDDFLGPDKVVATAKHYLADGGTFGGDDQGDARIGEEVLVKIHSPGYQAAIKAGVQTIMASFSSWNGVKMHTNHYLLTDILKGRMGFDGFVVGDWNAHGQVPGCSDSSCPDAINAGIDMIMVPTDWKAFIANTLEQVKSGQISTERLDDAVRRILRVKIRAHLWDAKPSQGPHAGDQSELGSPEHRALARQAVSESLVLLKNRGGVLPIKPKVNILVAGIGADNIPMQCGGWSLTWQGTDMTNDDYPGATSVYRGIEAAAKQVGSTVQFSATGAYDSKPDVAVVVFGEYPYAEGVGDRDTLEFEPGNKPSLRLLRKLKSAGIPVVSVFLSGRPMWVNPELNASDAFVAAFLPGTEGEGIADVLLAKADGSVNKDFSGRLSFSWPKLPTQDVLNPQDQPYDPLFPIGAGLDYAGGAEGPGQLDEDVKGVAVGASSQIDLYVGRALLPWTVYLHNNQYDQVLVGAHAALPQDDAVLDTVDKDVQEDALKLVWKDQGFNNRKLTFEGGAPMDLSDFMAKGTLSFDLKVVDFARTDLKLEMDCGDNCMSSVSLLEYGRDNVGKGWKNVSIALSCFVRDAQDYSAVPTPFSFTFGGAGEIQFANIRFRKEGKANFDCPNYKTLSTTPAMLREYWALDWWEPRHKEKLARIAQGNVDLVFIGDSITQGWERSGAPVWAKYYGKRNAVDLGFDGDRTENVLWRLQHGEVDGIDPKLVVLMIGTNNTGHRMDPPEVIAAGVEAILNELRTRLPNSKVLMLAIFPRGKTSDDPMRINNEKTNALIKNLADDKQVIFMDIGNKFLQDDGELSTDIMPDLLHPNETGYEIWAKNIEKAVDKYMGK